ncbi:ABC transporter permease (plasmid) [Agrobacterium tumefaciens]|jgi:peptide/nickel transport system permease protein|uniref:ABC transporter permease n=1 Tax=Agrobacterium TaxID=357 RepID=UPI0008100D28|nr:MULTISPECIES: ABC transporter permease [Agrobacterium]NSY46403.1 ABC transporter permease [Agrobacterium tumefaciens]NSZ76864.1 ABC transporter permease [Agrobacterium tumefaciens]NSZ87344.1 ABC transporter permease [Agrobacterium tumefaciens]UZX45350.1 ABC transporter permease [Agrobacterium sp. 13-2099-1-2]WCA72759.1 ABC transporter permease [Agrobacterium tumefaciens]
MAAIEFNETVAPEVKPKLLKRILFRKVSTTIAFVVILAFAMIAVFAPWIAPYDPLKQSFLSINKYPSAANWLGTDQFGRDVLSRLIYGSRTSLTFGLIAPVSAAVIGTTLGVLAGYFGGVTDRIISKLIDILMAFPELLLAIIVSAALGGGFWNVVIVLTIAFVPGFARVARAATLSVRQEPYIEASMAIGVKTPIIIFRHVIPNMSASIVLLGTLWIASAIRLEAALSFLGIGTPPPNPSWGNIIREGLGNVFGSPWPIIGAGFAITIIVLCINLIGDSARDVLDPNSSEC